MSEPRTSGVEPGTSRGAGAYLNVVFNLPSQNEFTYLRGDHADCGIGRRVVAPFGKREMVGYVVSQHNEKPRGSYAVREITRVIDAEPLFDAEYLDLARWVAGMYLCSLGEALATMLPGGRRESRSPILDEDDESAPAVRHELAPQQEGALTGILSATERISYLFGVTGSGKTEVYLRAAENLIADGSSAIYLVPEISLTHQLVEIVRDRFRDNLAVLHSGLTPSQKLVEWLRICRGEATFVIGARSAVFAPVSNLGLIVIDEEHEGSFKSGSTPRYHARQVAMHRCAKSGARLVLGSATPSVEAYHLMSGGRVRRLDLPNRLAGGSMPAVELVDMKRETGCISTRLAAEIRATAEEGRQSILFLNRRGFSHFFNCRSCGYEMTCSRCSVALTYHKDRDRMICHYCGYSRRPVESCPQCGSLDVGYAGFGTEMIESEVARRFPDLKVVRVDADSIRQKGRLKDLLAAFRRGEIDLLLGTQMVAKGLNFPGVKLVGIVLADTGLHLPDFRAEERTFALIVQVAGRAGRYIPDGRVIIQTFRPDASAIRLAAKSDLESFYAGELESRRELGFPPYTRLIRLVFRGRNLENVRESASGFASAYAAASGGADEVLGPAECPLGVISHNHRYQVILRTKHFSFSHSLVGKTVGAQKPRSGVYVELDVDPVSLL